MLKWILTTVIALIFVSGLSPLLQRFGLGRLPGDFSFHIGRRHFYLPVTTTILVSMAAALIARML